MKGARVWSLAPVFTGPAEEKGVQKETEKQLVKKKENTGGCGITEANRRECDTDNKYGGYLKGLRKYKN